MSTLLAAVVTVGAEPDHFTEVNVEEKDPAPVFKNNKKLFPATKDGIVKVQFPVKVQV